jgi:hypothetical protein
MEIAFILMGLSLAGLVALRIWSISEALNEQDKVAKMPPEERARYIKAKEELDKAKEERAEAFRKSWEERSATSDYGPINPQMVCPHCQSKGSVRTKPVIKKAGISGGKTTAAILTGGLSMLATGLSRKEGMTQAHCDQCTCTWVF